MSGPDHIYQGQTMDYDFTLEKGHQPIRYEIYGPNGTLVKEGSFDLGKSPYDDPDQYTEGLWRMDSIENQTVIDSSGKDNHGKGHGSTLVDSEFLKGITPSSHIDVTSSQSINISGTKLTVEFWVKVPSASPAERMILVDKEESYQVEIRGDREIKWALMTVTQDWYLVDTDISLPLDVWNYIAFTYDGMNGRTYLNGNLLHTQPYENGNVATSRYPLGLGGGLKWYPSSGWTWSFPMSGSLDEVRISSSVRSAQSINRTYMDYLKSSAFKVSFETGPETPIGTYRIASWYGDVTMPDHYFEVRDGHQPEVRDLIARAKDRSILLSWKEPIEGPLPLLGYRLFKGLSPLSLSLLYETTNVSYLDTNLENGRTYFYKVCAFNIVNVSLGVLASEHPRTIPGPPLGLIATPSNGSVVLSWDPPAMDGGSPVTGYNVYRMQEGEEFAMIESVEETQLRDGDLINGIAYAYLVRTLNSEGESTNSTIVTIVPRTRPSAPRDPVLSRGNGTINLTWIEPADDGGSEIFSYIVIRKRTWDNEIRSWTLDPSITWLNDKDVVRGYEYSYVVQAVSAGGNSPSSRAVVGIAAVLPSGPRMLKAHCGDGFAELSWYPPEDDGDDPISAYLLFRDHKGTRTEIGNIPASMTDFNDTGLENGEEDEYYLLAQNGIGFSGPETITAVPATVPGPVIGFEAIYADGIIKLAWQAPTDDGGDPVKGYRIYRLAELGEVLIAEIRPENFSFEDRVTERGKTQTYRMVGINAMGESLSSTAEVKVPLDASSSSPGLLIAAVLVGFSIIVLVIVFALILFIRKDGKKGNVIMSPEPTSLLSPTNGELPIGQAPMPLNDLPLATGTTMGDEGPGDVPGGRLENDHSFSE